MSQTRDAALVLSGGGINGLLLEIGFLQGLRQTSLWPRVGWIYGTSAGALTGTMAALDRMDELERFCLELKPEETFRPNRLWQLPLTGLHDYALPETIARKLEPPERIAEQLAAAPVEMVVCVTDVTSERPETADHAFERTFASRTTPPDVMAQAILASAAISALVLPVRVADVIATDGAWVRNFPLGHAYENPSVHEIVGFRYLSAGWNPTGESLARLKSRLERFRAVPPVKALIAELERAGERHARGEPPHLADMMGRLMRVAVARNSSIEERWAAERDATMRELAALRRDLLSIADRPDVSEEARAALRARLDASSFPLKHERALPVTVIRADVGPVGLDPGFRPGLTWPVEVKRAVIERGRALAAQVAS
ncbi:MAG: hypothetical protein FJW96_04500 [Actinobacteria bacterium]|nr:hypothetical protein [Actinomycetota bacterium]